MAALATVPNRKVDRASVLYNMIDDVFDFVFLMGSVRFWFWSPGRDGPICFYC